MATTKGVEAAAREAGPPPPPSSLVVPWSLQSACLEHIGAAPAHPILPGYHVKDVEVEGLGFTGEDSFRWARITVTFGEPDPGAASC